jgi:hypothetical protein
MNKKEIRMQMEQITPDVPSAFHEALEGTLGLICRKEAATRSANSTNDNRNSFKRRTLVIVMASVLVIATVAVAAGLHYGLFDTLLGAGRDNAEAFIQRNLAKVSFNECDVEVKEAAYDGISLYLVYSVRERAALKPAGVYDETAKRWFADESSLPAMQRDNIGWWVDHIWINGKSIDMPNMSGGDTMGSETPGELLFYQMYRLDQENVYLNGKVEISLPIGERQPPESLKVHKDPYSVELPQKGMITFTLDASARDGILTTHPNEEKDMPTMTAKVSESIYSPLNLYITLDYTVKPQALEAYIAENGMNGGKVDSEQKEYFADEIAGQWTMGLDLVDINGKPVFDGTQGFGGIQGSGKGRVWYMYPALDAYPDELFLAPVDGGMAEMSLAVRVK